MKLKQTNEGWENANGGSSFSKKCVKSCKGILAQISWTKDAIFAEARGTLKLQDQMLRLALNEAEALAWQTLYPHLVFPALAAEKVQGVAAWNNHQRLVSRQARPLTF
jgi:hypothetical protein